MSMSLISASSRHLVYCSSDKVSGDTRWFFLNSRHLCLALCYSSARLFISINEQIQKMHKNTLSYNDSISPRIPPLCKYVSMYKCMCRKPGNLGRAIVLMSRLPLKAHRWRRTDKNIQYVPFGVFGWKRRIPFQICHEDAVPLPDLCPCAWWADHRMWEGCFACDDMRADGADAALGGETDFKGGWVRDAVL